MNFQVINTNGEMEDAGLELFDIIMQQPDKPAFTFINQRTGKEIFLLFSPAMEVQYYKQL